MSKIVFEDKNYERMVADEISEARVALQNLLDQWNALKLNSITTKSELYDLVSNPQQMYSEGLLITRKKSSDTNVEAPQSSPPDPNGFYSAARAAKTAAYSDREYGIFGLEKNKVVVIKEASDVYVYNRTIVADTPEQEQFAKDVETFTRMFNLINSKLGNYLVEVAAYRSAWSQILALPPEPYSDTAQYPASFKTDKLRELIQLV